MTDIMEIYNNISNVISFLANLCVLGITIYTFYLTVFSRKLSFVSMGFSSSLFYGESISISLLNQSLHAIPVTEVFLLKRIEGKFYRISFQKYDNPIIIEPWHICNIEMNQFTHIVGPTGENIDLVDIHMETMIGVEIGNRHVVWIRPYRHAPYMLAKRAYKRNQYEWLTVSRHIRDGKTLSEAVNYIIYLKTVDVNGNKKWKTIYAIIGKKDGILSEAICGYNSIKIKKCKNEKDLKKQICSQLEISEDSVYVVKDKYVLSESSK